MPFKKIFSRLIAAFSFILFFELIMACVRSAIEIDPVEINIEHQTLKPEPIAVDATHALKKQMRLKELTDENPGVSDYVRDITLMLEAEDLAAKEQWRQAAEKWRQALATADGSFVEYAFKGLVKNHMLLLKAESPAKEKPEIDKVANELLAINEVKQNSFAKKNNLLTTELLKPWLLKNHADLLKTNTMQQQIATAERKPTPPAPAKGGIPAEDPLLVKTSQNYCAELKRRETQTQDTGSAPSDAESQSTANWDHWISSLTFKQKSYFDALTLKCQGQIARSDEAFALLFVDFSKTPQYRHFAMQSGRELISSKKMVGDREAMADLYMELSNLWDKNIAPQQLALTSLEADLLKVDDFLSTSRYRSMMADYDNAKLYCQKALDRIAIMITDHNIKIGSASYNKVMDLKAESYHTLAFRIAQETGDFDAAKAWYKLASEIPGLQKKWKQTVDWHAGLVDYQRKDYASAILGWELLLKDTDVSTSLQAQVLYWLYRAHQQSNDALKSNDYRQRLVDRFPLSFYAIQDLKDGDMNDEWRQAFSDLPKLKSELADASHLNLQTLRSNHKLGRLLLRAEIISYLQDSEWTRLAVSDLARPLKADYLPQRNLEMYVYLTRLYLLSNQYPQSISLNTELIDLSEDFWKTWPEQLLVYFPLPGIESFKRNGGDHGVDPELLLAISRQESAFNASAISPAGALGLMQLMPATATAVARRNQLATERLEQRLFEPEVNITLGTLYIKTLSLRYNSYYPAIIAAYNAGEYVVDVWQKRRHQDDPMLWIETIPFKETRDYVKNVWRNHMIYKNILQQQQNITLYPQHRQPL